MQRLSGLLAKTILVSHYSKTSHQSDVTWRHQPVGMVGWLFIQFVKENIKACFAEAENPPVAGGFPWKGTSNTDSITLSCSVIARMLPCAAGRQPYRLAIKTRPVLERRETLGRLRSINPNMINHFASQSQTCQLLKMIFTRGQFWPSGIVVASVCVCVCLCVCSSITSLSAR